MTAAHHALLADLTVLAHAGFVLFVVLGGVLVLRRPWLAWLHLPAVAWGVWVELYGAVCPLTPLENAWRAQSGGVSYAGGFIEHYVTAALYPAGLSRGMQLALGLGLLALNLGLYARAWRRHRGR